jgi:Icc-related predicted phosphoesterase
MSKEEIELTEKTHPGMVRVCIISDTHTTHEAFTDLIPKGIDILVHAGDITMTSRKISQKGRIHIYRKFNEWLGLIKALTDVEHIVVVAGNHDGLMQEIGMEASQEILSNAIYLENSEVHLLGLKIWGSPVSTGHSMNRAFQDGDFANATKNALPLDGSTDILITHGPSEKIANLVQPNIAHIWGHVHECHGYRIYNARNRSKRKNHHEQENEDDSNDRNKTWLSVCGTNLNTRYQPVRGPLVLDIDTVDKNIK